MKNRDREWVRTLVENGDERAFRHLYRAYTPRLYGFVLRVIRGAESDAEDVVQDTWLKAVANLHRFRWESSFSTWLIGIGLNQSREFLRRRARLQPTDNPVVDLLPAPQVRQGEPGKRLDLERAIGRLSDGYRQILVMHDIEGWTHREIAENLGISEGTSKSQLFNARRQVRAMLRPAVEVEVLS